MVEKLTSRFEYVQIVLRPDADGDPPRSTESLNILGGRGWEMVSCVSAGANWIRFFFKRPLSPRDDEGGA